MLGGGDLDFFRQIPGAAETIVPGRSRVGPRVMAVGMALVLVCATGIVGADARGPATARDRSSASATSGWTSITSVITPTLDTRGYAATAFDGRAYIVDVTNISPNGSDHFSKLWFTTDNSGRWVRTLVASLKDDPGTAVSLPRIAVIPASHHVVVTALRGTDVKGVEGPNQVIAYTNRSGVWMRLMDPLRLTHGAVINPNWPSLAAYGSKAVLAFDADYSDTRNVCAQVAGNIFESTFTDGSASWSPPVNVTHNYCTNTIDPSKNPFARAPMLAFSRNGTLFMAYSLYSNAGAGVHVRVGTFDAGADQVADAGNFPWTLSSQVGLYALAVDAANQPHVAYLLDNGAGAERLMYATKVGGTWQRTQLDTGASDSGVQSIAPSIAVTDGGPAVAYVRDVAFPLGGNGGLAVFLRHVSGGAWLPAYNVTRSDFTDSAPVLAASDNLLHLFLSSAGPQEQLYLYTRELPFPRFSETLSAPYGHVHAVAEFHATQQVSLAGIVAPAATTEAVTARTERWDAVHARWMPVDQAQAQTTVQSTGGSFAAVHPALPAGYYRIRVEVSQTLDHLAGGAAWQVFIVT